MASRVNVAVTGGGIVGLATGVKILERAPGLSVVVLEKEDGIAAHQTGHNSGVIHSGLSYRPGSEKAKTCVEGRRLLIEFCESHGISHEICGKLVVAASESELPALAELERRAGANGLEGVRNLGPAEFRKVEPHVAGVRALHVPATGIVDYRAVSAKFAELIGARGPNTQINAACASTTQAVGLAEDWIRAGRCRRVVVVSGDGDCLGEGGNHFIHAAKRNPELRDPPVFVILHGRAPLDVPIE